VPIHGGTRLGREIAHYGGKIGAGERDAIHISGMGALDLDRHSGHLLDPVHDFGQACR
jgi:hypothetical protein